MGVMCFGVRQWSKAITAMGRAATIDPSNWKPAGDLAWLLATCPDASLRNGPQAVEWAERACRLSENKQPFCLRALAAAYAETGRFEDAVRQAEDALKIATDSGLAALARQITAQLLQYRQGRAYYLSSDKP